MKDIIRTRNNSMGEAIATNNDRVLWDDYIFLQKNIVPYTTKYIFGFKMAQTRGPKHYYFKR